MLSGPMSDQKTRQLISKLLDRGYENLMNAQRLMEQLTEPQPARPLTEEELVRNRLAVFLGTLDALQNDWDRGAL